MCARVQFSHAATDPTVELQYRSRAVRQAEAWVSSGGIICSTVFVAVAFWASHQHGQSERGCQSFEHIRAFLHHVGPRCAACELLQVVPLSCELLQVLPLSCELLQVLPLSCERIQYCHGPTPGLLDLHWADRIVVFVLVTMSCGHHQLTQSVDEALAFGSPCRTVATGKSAVTKVSSCPAISTTRMFNKCIVTLTPLVHTNTAKIQSISRDNNRTVVVQCTCNCAVGLRKFL